jgi:hypothetical protein
VPVGFIASRVRKLLYSGDLEVEGIVENVPPLNEKQIHIIKGALYRVSLMDYQISGIEPELADKPVARVPLNLLEVKHLTYSPIFILIREESLKAGVDCSFYWPILEELNKLKRDLTVIKRSKSEMDIGSFQRKIAILTSAAAIFSAISAIGSLVVAYLQYKHPH